MRACLVTATDMQEHFPQKTSQLKGEPFTALTIQSCTSEQGCGTCSNYVSWK